MGIFCGETCQCKNRCDADLQWNSEAKKGCRQACKTDNPPASGYAWLDAQRPEVQILYSYEPNQAAQLQQQQEQYAQDGQAAATLSPGLIVVAVALVIGAIFLIKRFRK